MTRPRKLTFVWLTFFLVAIALLLGSVLNLFFVEKKLFKISSDQIDGSKINAAVYEVKKGVFISGGHAWSIGSIKRTYCLEFSETGRQLEWNGMGVPIVLQRDGANFFLATFDRETDFSRSDFMTYKWEGKWMHIPTAAFPLRLTELNNLIKLDAASGSQSDFEFSTSILARFWYCVANGTHNWEVSDSEVTEDFVRGYRARLAGKNEQ